MEKIINLDINDQAFKAIKNGIKKVETRVTTNKKKKDYGNIKSGDIIIFSNSKNERLRCKVIENIWYKNEKELLMIEGTKYTLSSTKDFQTGVKSINSFKNYTQGIKENGIYAIHIKSIEVNNFDMKLKKEYYDSVIKGTKRIELRLNDEKRQKIKINDTITFHLFDDYNKFFTVKVVGLSYYKSIQDLINDYKIENLISNNITSEELTNIFNSIYKLEDQEKYGILGISFVII